MMYAQHEHYLVMPLKCYVAFLRVRLSIFYDLGLSACLRRKSVLPVGA